MALVTSASQLSLGSLTSTQMLADLVRRCSREEEFCSAFATIASYCGFDAFSYLLLADTTGGATLMHHWTSACARWRNRYAERQYQFADPRVLLTQGRSVPIRWHGTHVGAPRTRAAFAVDAARFGLHSGVAVSFDDARVGRIVLAWDCAGESAAAERAATIERELGALMLLAGFIREAMLDPCRSALSRRLPAALTPRERQCVAYAARGMTSADIGTKLGITGRTVNFHFGNITAKLGVLNRAEAIVRAIALHAVPPV
jgi:DNA-binding CsgD family transcriptional regulator